MERPVGFPEASAVAEGVFCGGLFDAFDEALVRRLGITHAVILASLPGAWDARKNRYVTLSPPAIRDIYHVAVLDDPRGTGGGGGGGGGGNGSRDGRPLSAEVLMACSNCIYAALLHES